MARWTRLLAPWTELRIDVDPPPHETAADLDALERRLLCPGAPLRRQCRPLPCAPPGFRFWHRVADGEHFVYIEDVMQEVGFQLKSYDPSKALTQGRIAVKP